MRKKESMFYSYRIITEEAEEVGLNRKRRSGGCWLEFHTSWDKDEVRQGKNLNRAICLKDLTKFVDVFDHHERLAYFMTSCEHEIDLYKMQRVRSEYKMFVPASASIPEFIRPSKNTTNRSGKLTDQEVKALHERCSDWQSGEKIFFSSEVHQEDSMLERINYICAKSARFHSYQPRKKLVWLQFSKKDVKNPSKDRRDLIYPFTLKEVRRHNMRRTDAMYAKGESVGWLNDYFK